MGGLALRSISGAESKPKRPENKTFILSKTGCSRATGYAETNKIVTLGGKTHVAWLDSVSGGFRVRLRTLDRASGSWSPTYTIGEAFDNHGGPALAADSKGHLHAVYYPHHHPFRYRRSRRPNDASTWEEEIRFGKRCTYPTLLCGPDDTLYLTCRESSSDPWVVNLYTKPPGKEWLGPTAILRGESAGGYAHFQEALAWAPDRRTIHLSCRIHDGNPGRAHTVGYLRSPDSGKTWERIDGTRVKLPASPEDLTLIADGRRETRPALRCGAMAVDAVGKPHILYSCAARLPFEAWIAVPETSGRWRHSSLLKAIGKEWPGWGLSMPGGITIGPEGKIFVALTLMKPETGEDSIWAHPTSEIVRMVSTDGGETFTARQVSRPGPPLPHWLPNLERQTGHNEVGTPSLIYTAGTRGTNNREIVSDEVHWFGGED